MIEISPFIEKTVPELEETFRFLPVFVFTFDFLPCKIEYELPYKIERAKQPTGEVTAVFSKP